jgi:hypothetical protein
MRGNTYHIHFLINEYKHCVYTTVPVPPYSFLLPENGIFSCGYSLFLKDYVCYFNSLSASWIAVPLHTWLNSYNSGIVWNINVWMYCMNSLKKTFLIHKGYIRSKGITLREKHGPLTPPLTFLWWQTASLISKNPNTAIDVLPSYW